jgi:hypothetical protein
MSYQDILYKLSKFNKCYFTKVEGFTSAGPSIFIDNSSHVFVGNQSNSDSVDDTFDKCENCCKAIFLGLFALVFSLGIVAIVAYDDFILYLRNSISYSVDKIDDKDLKYHYREWLDIFYFRVRNKFIAKLLIFISIPIILFGIDGLGYFIGFTILIMAACYLLWVNLTNELYHEKNKFDLLQKYVVSKTYMNAERDTSMHSYQTQHLDVRNKTQS